MPRVTMSDKDRAELERRCDEVEKYARAVEERDRFMTELYDEYRADPADLLEASGIRARSQLYNAFHRYGSNRVRLRSHRPAVRDRRREEEGT
jgi:hypothetical protein